MTAQDTEIYPGMSALELANAFLAEMGSGDEREKQMTRSAVMAAAEFLAETAGPLRWEAIDVEEFVRRIAFMSKRELEGQGIALMGFYGWLCTRGVLAPGEGLEILEGIRSSFPNSPIIGHLYTKSQLMLQEMIDDMN